MVTPLNKDLFAQRIQGQETSLHFLRNGNTEVAITNYGARIVALIVPDRNNERQDVVVGFDSLEGYLHSTETYHGAIVGRYANRIARGKFSLHGNSYQLAINNPPNHLHGGPHGFHNQVWQVKAVTDTSIRLFHLSKNGEENYPGNLSISVLYQLSGDNELSIHYEAVTDEATIINVTAHPFFNLNGIGSGTIENHLLRINADHYNPVDESLIPTGIFPVDKTPLYFRTVKKIGAQIRDKNTQLEYGAGYDHNFVLNGEGARRVAEARGDRSGIRMTVITTEPGMQLYSGNYMQAENRIKYGLIDHFREAFCLETQHFPDSPNHPGFPSTVLEPGEIFRSSTTYGFSLDA
jgi:aldose 1-epimerase